MAASTSAMAQQSWTADNGNGTFTNPLFYELRRRLEGRATDSPEVIESRLARAAYELTFAPKFDHVIVNDQLPRAQQEALAIIKQFLDQQ